MTTQSSNGYEQIAEAQKRIEANFSLVKQAVMEAEKKILQRRQQVIAAIQEEQSKEAAKLDAIINLVKDFIVPDQI